MSDNIKNAVVEYEYPAGNWLSIGHPSVAEVSAHLGFDFVLIDTEHTAMGLETVENMVRAVDAVDGDTDVLVRVPSNDPVRIKRVLDLGISGVMVPMIETVDEARRLGEAVRYPPEGIRGIAGGRAADYGMGFPEYVREANGSILTVAQIETERGLRNVEEIASVDGIDALFVGPADLSGALDVFARWESDKLREAMKSVVDAGHAAGTPVGTLTVDQADIDERIDQGFDFLIVGKDASYFAAGSRDAKEQYENVVARRSEARTETD